MAGQLSEIRKSALSALLSDSGNVVVWRGLTEAFRSSSNAPIPVVGAMFQRMVGLQPWSDFLRQLTQEINVERARNDDTTIENITRSAGRMFLDDAIDAQYFSPVFPSPLPPALALVPHLVTDLLLGSTISHEIEAAFRAAGPPPLKARDLYTLGDVSLESPGLRLQEPLLLKLRGDVSNRATRAITWSEYKDRLSGSSQFASFRKGLEASKRPLLFLGMSIQGSPLIDVLPTTAEGMPPSYALLDATTRSGPFTAWLYGKNIRPLWYQPGSGELEAALVDLAEALHSPIVPKPASWPVPDFYVEQAAAAAALQGPHESFVEKTGREKTPSPLVPQGLVDAIISNECVVFVGSGLAARAGMPTWRGFVAGLVDQALSLGLMTSAEAAQQRAALSDGEINSVADNAISAFSSDRAALLEYYGRASTPQSETPRAVSLLRSISFVGVLTTNYDKMLSDDGVTPLTPRDGEALLAAHATPSQRYFVQLYGDLDRPETVVTAPAEYQDLVRSNAAFSRFVEGIFFSRTILFVGTSLEGLTDFLGGFRFPSGVPRAHYALVAVQGQSWQAKAQTLKRRYNIEVLPYPESESYIQFDEFLADLANKASQVGAPLCEAPVAGEPLVTRIEMRNIGPFQSLDLDFRKLRTILLGDNGVGKSTILKAIAITIVGSDGRHYAGRLLRSGEPYGSIRVVTRRNPSGYLAEIQKVGEDTEVISRSGRMLETEAWLALGFPPLRTTKWTPVQGPQGTATRRPAAGDLVPLLSGDVDFRMDDLKQWLVNTDAATRDDRGTEESRGQATSVIRTFLDAVSVLSEGLSISLETVTADFRVLVRTPDGVVPIESLSQGMTSLLSWIGIVIQRLHEVGGTGGTGPADVMHSAALILMDEIDAHMHPAWQQKLLPRLKLLLPNVQIIASTHSPLVVAGLEAAEVVRFDRDPSGKVVRLEIEEDMTVGRADQILTGDLFGLESTLALGERGDAMRGEYERLLGKSSRTDDEEDRFAELGTELNERIPPALAETKLERRSQELVLAVLTSDFSSGGEVGRVLVEKATQVMQSMGWKDLELPEHVANGESLQKD